MGVIQSYLIILFLTLFIIPLVMIKWKGILTVAVVTINALLAAYLALNVLTSDATEFFLNGTLATGVIPLRIDALSAWFILLINFTMVTGAFYGLQYMKAYKDQTANITIHCAAFLLMQSSLTFICIIQNFILFLTVWEIMTLSAFVLVIFEHYKPNTLKAGINFLIQSHIGIVILTVGFLWVASKTGSYDFNAITDFSASYPLLVSLALSLCFFSGFSFKAGFVPFHTWLPYAHPAAPSHVSGVMSGVMIKIGIYGILRILLLVRTDFTLLGYIILTIAIISGIYGVMLAIVQHNLKKLLAYHSIENIGIIGIGIGLGTVGIGMDNPYLATLGFAGALLHVLNHSLFKSLLFYSAGNVYQATHTMNIDRLGGLVKRMPHTTFLFLMAALAICGLPPLNGFISEFLIYSGLFKGLGSSNPVSLMGFLSSIFGLAFIGGLAMLCFTKATGSVFLGTPREQFRHSTHESKAGKLIPMYAILMVIISIGLFPQLFLQILSGPVQLFTEKLTSHTGNVISFGSAVTMMRYIGFCAMAFIALAGGIFFLKRRISAQKKISHGVTWGCGYVGESGKMQYTASSFVRSYRKLFEPITSMHSIRKEISGVFPKKTRHETHPFDKIEEWLIDAPLLRLKYFFNRFRFLQNGNPQFYVLYGVVFITLVMAVPWLFGVVQSVIEFLNKL